MDEYAHVKAASLGYRGADILADDMSGLSTSEHRPKYMSYYVDDPSYNQVKPNYDEVKPNYDQVGSNHQADIPASVVKAFSSAPAVAKHLESATAHKHLPIKELTAQLYLSVVTSITMDQIPSYADTMIPKLYAAAEHARVDICGPSEFMYIGCNGDPDIAFSLRIAIPINRRIAVDKQFEIFESQSANCIHRDYVGSMGSIGAGWAELMRVAALSGLELSSEIREVYKEWYGPSSVDNVTELQAIILPGSYKKV
jgi:hypothetical protein